MNLYIGIILASILYRLGGIGRPFDTKYRDFGVPIVALLVYAGMCNPWLYFEWWRWLLSFLLMFGACTTYHSWLSRLLGYKDGEERWFNYAMHGFAFAFAILPLVWGEWPGFLIRCGVVSTLTALWSHYTHTDWIEEKGRGVIFIASLPLLTIGG